MVLFDIPCIDAEGKDMMSSKNLNTKSPGALFSSMGVRQTSFVCRSNELIAEQVERLSGHRAEDLVLGAVKIDCLHQSAVARVNSPRELKAATEQLFCLLVGQIRGLPRMVIKECAGGPLETLVPSWSNGKIRMVYYEDRRKNAPPTLMHSVCVVVTAEVDGVEVPVAYGTYIASIKSSPHHPTRFMTHNELFARQTSELRDRI